VKSSQAIINQQKNQLPYSAPQNYTLQKIEGLYR